MKYELIRYDVLNGTRKKHEDANGLILNSPDELEIVRQLIQDDHPECEVFLTYKHIPVCP